MRLALFLSNQSVAGHNTRDGDAGAPAFVVWTCAEAMMYHSAPTSMRRATNVGLLLGQRCRRWPNRRPTLAQRPFLFWHSRQRRDPMLG